jgi:two-component system LytT family response regulator
MPAEIFGRLRGSCCAFLYWLAFLVALEPGNVLRAQNAGHPLEFGIEALRICLASLLGSSSAPVLIALARRFPLSNTRRRRNVAIHAVGTAGLSFVLIVISCFLAAWVLMLKPLPTMPEIRGQLANNWLLLTFALGAFALLIKALNVFPQRRLSSIPVKTRGRAGELDLARVEWIESQGNYLALHEGGKSHLIRETLQSFAARIDPGRFIRVHRRTIVDIRRVREIRALGNGDAELLLEGGETIRVSRSHGAAVRERWAEVSARR